MDVTRNIRLLFWFNFFTDFKLYAPIAILYFSEISRSFALGMSIFSIIMISSALCEVPTGIISDRLGRKNTLIFGSFAAVLSVLLYAIGGSFVVLALGAVGEGLSRAFYSGNNDALLYDTLREVERKDEYPRHYGHITSMFQVALALSGIVGSLLAPWSFPLILWLSVIAQTVCLFLAFQIKEPYLQSKKSGNIYQHLSLALKQFRDNKKLRLLTISGIIGYACGEAMYQFQAAFYATLLPVWAVGLVKTAGNMQAALSFRFGHLLLPFLNPFKLLIVDNVYNRFINILAVVFPTVISPIIMSTTSLFFGISSTAKNLLAQKEFTNEQRATMGSLGTFAGSIVFGIVAFMLGLTADYLSPTIAIVGLQLFQLINIFLYTKLYKIHA